MMGCRIRASLVRPLAQLNAVVQNRSLAFAAFCASLRQTPSQGRIGHLNSKPSLWPEEELEGAHPAATAVADPVGPSRITIERLVVDSGRAPGAVPVQAPALFGLGSFPRPTIRVRTRLSRSRYRYTTGVV